ncbi:hypothetical protein KAW80_02470 [Candidatus Babeliales bacterium]|nr:hypothetical protein [Candidatus Babeliales bacterium]
MKKQFKAATKSSLLDFIKDSDFVNDDKVSSSLKSLSEYRLEYIKMLAQRVQDTLLEGFDKSCGDQNEIENLKNKFDRNIKKLNYGNLEQMKESLSGTVLGLMIILGLSQKVHGSDYWPAERGWKDYEVWLKSMNKNIYAFDEEIKKLLNAKAQA